MAHLHDVIDDDPHFKIDADTRTITRTSENEPVLIQGDHNSERYTFEIPKSIDGHEVMLCNLVRIHFINVSAENEFETSPGIYEVKDLKLSRDDPTKAVFTWLIDKDATMLVGTLNFVVEFLCTNAENVIEYSWHTGIGDGGVVLKSMDNSDIIIGKYYDVLDQWLARIDEAGTAKMNKVEADIETAKVNAINYAKSVIDDHADTVRQDLTAYGLSAKDVLVQEKGQFEDKVISQKAVTDELNGLEDRVNSNITQMRSETNALRVNAAAEIFELVTGIYGFNKLNAISMDGEVVYVFEPEVTYLFDNIYGIRLEWAIEYIVNFGNATWSLPITKTLTVFAPTDDDVYSRDHGKIRINKCELKVSSDGAKIEATVDYELNGVARTITEEYGDAGGGAVSVSLTDTTFIAHQRNAVIVYAVSTNPEISGDFTLNANGISDINKTATNGLTNTYTILLDDGTTKTFVVKDGVGVSDMRITEHGECEDTHRIDFTDGTCKLIKVPNNNSVGIRTSDSGAVIHATDLIPLEHTVKAKVKSKNMIPYPWGEGDIETDGKVEKDGVTYTIDEDKTLILNGTAACNTSFNLSYQYNKKIPVTKGKKYTFSCTSELSGSRGYIFLQICVSGEIKQTKTIRNNEVVTFTSEHDGYVSIGVVLLQGITFDNERVQIQLEESDAATPYTPYVNPSDVKLKKCGKNLIPVTIKSGTTIGGITVTTYEESDGSCKIVANGTATASPTFDLFAGAIRVKGTYTLSGMTGGSGTTYYIQPHVSGVGKPGMIEGSKTYEDLDGVLTRIGLSVVTGTTLDNLTIYLQLEPGSEATDYEPYVGEEYSIASDGVPIERVTSLTPTMNLLTDKAGVVIDTTYNVDQTAAYNRINTLLETLLNGGA